MRKKHAEVVAHLMKWVAWGGYDPRNSADPLATKLTMPRGNWLRALEGDDLDEGEVSELHSESEANRYLSVFLRKQAE